MDMLSGPSGSKRLNEDINLVCGSTNNGAKKMKTDRPLNGFVSKVVHLRSLPSDVTENEVIQVGLNYGKVTNILMLKGKNQAFLEMESEEIAENMVSECAINPPSIRQRLMYIQFSNHKELKTDSSPNQMKAQAVLQAMQQTEGGTNHVLRVVVENMLYPITLDVLHTIFSKFGVVLKTITFTKNNQFQALIQMGDAVQSQTAKLSLDGQNIYNGCCTLRIEYSKLPALNVKYNNDKSRDYMRNDLPSGEAILSTPGPVQQQILPNPTSIIPPNFQSHAASIAAAIQQSQMNLPPSSNSPNLLKNAAVAAHIAALVGASNVNQQQNQQPQHGMNHMQQQHLHQQPMHHQGSNASVLHVSNLNEDDVTPHVLFMLFGVYGDVIRVKILFQKKSNALIQMFDNSQALVAMKYLHGVKLFGNSLQVVMSRHNQVQMPKEGQDQSNLTKDFSNSPLHRFKKPGSKNFQNIYPPSEVLHLSNIPQEVPEKQITEKFGEFARVDAFRFFQKDRRMALIKLGSIEEAVKCLINLHNHKLSDNSHLRVSFSKGHI